MISIFFILNYSYLLGLYIYCAHRKADEQINDII